MDAAADSVTAIRVENGNGAFTIAKEDETWKVTAPESGTSFPVGADEAEALVRGFVNLSIADPFGPIDEGGQGFAAPASRVTISAGGGHRAT